MSSVRHDTPTAVPALSRRTAHTPTIPQLTLALMILGLVWRSYQYALGMPIWGDEAFVAVNFVMRDFRGMIEPLVYGQIVPLGFMWAELAVSHAVGLSERALHLLPFLAGFAALVAFHRFCRRTLPPSAALPAVGFFAGSYFIVRHSTEVKPYSTDLLIGLSFTMLGWGVAQRMRSTWRWAALIAFAAAAIWCSYPAMFVGGSVALLLAWRLVKSRFPSGPLSGLVLYGLVLCGSALAMYRFYGKPHAEHASPLFELQSWARTFPPIGEPWKLPVWFYEAHTGNMFAYPQGGSAPGSIGTFALFVVGAARMWRRNRELLVLLLGPFPLTFVAAAMRAYPYGGSARVAQYVAPAICILAGLGLSAVMRRFLRGRHLRNAMLISTVALSVIPIGSMIKSTVRPYKSRAVLAGHEAVATVAARTSPNDQWIVFNADRQVPYAPYLGDWRGVGGQFVFDVMRFATVPVTWAPVPETVERRPEQTVWLLVFYAQRSKVSFPDDQLDAYVATLTERLGVPATETFVISERPGKYEALRVYRFGADDGASPLERFNEDP